MNRPYASAATSKLTAEMYAQLAYGASVGMTVVGFHASHEQIPPAELLTAVRPPSRQGSRRRCARTTSPRGARGRASPAFAWSWLGAALQATAAVRRGQRPRPALPPGDHRAGDRHPRPRCSRAGSGRRSAPARPATSTSPATAGRARTCATRGCGSASTSSGRCWAARRSATTAWSRGPRPAVDPPGAPPQLVGAGCQRRDRALVRRWADGLITVNAPQEHLREMIAAYRDAGGRGPDCTCRSTSPGTPTRGRLDRPRPVAQQRLRPAGLLGPRTAEDFDVVSRARPAGAGCTRRCTSPRPRPACGMAGTSTRELGFDEIYLHHVGREQRRSSTRSARPCSRSWASPPSPGKTCRRASTDDRLRPQFLGWSTSPAALQRTFSGPEHSSGG